MISGAVPNLQTKLDDGETRLTEPLALGLVCGAQRPGFLREKKGTERGRRVLAGISPTARPGSWQHPWPRFAPVCMRPYRCHGQRDAARAGRNIPGVEACIPFLPHYGVRLTENRQPVESKGEQNSNTWPIRCLGQALYANLFRLRTASPFLVHTPALSAGEAPN
ncbi:hypothetical protein JZ751_029400 [Albula glossodonta]|uniref:Uncharacterized protein n=1 Tax=Albula glossodonta TaxID=121402 RepID=A0A8T2PAT5_9TELE|nr:hypothetical protein JZ751_029400 [Albula glossodonta]